MSATRCPYDEDDRVSFAWGEMEAGRAAAFRAHLESCPSCRAAVAELAEAADLCRQVREATEPEPEWSRGFEPAGQRERARRWKWLWIPAAAAAAALLVLLAVSLGGRPDAPTSPAPPGPGARIAAMKGMVRVQPPGSAGSLPAAAAPGIGTGDCLLTGDASWAALELGDGSRILLEADSRLRFAALGESGAQLDLLAGELSCDVRPRLPGQVFIVSAGPGSAIVRGTRFAVWLAADGRMNLEVDRGIVELKPREPGPEPLLVHAGQQASFARGDERIQSRAAAGKPPAAPPPRKRRPESAARPGDRPAAGQPAARTEPGSPSAPPAPDEAAAQPGRPGADTVEALVAQLYQDSGWIFDEIRAAMERGDHGAALRMLDNFLGDPDSPDKDRAMLLKAACLERTGRSREAQRIYREYLSRWPAGRLAPQAKQGYLRTRR
ncbi:MAG: FecR domain-containing protein [Deltaproteobacteria bacterium]|nr:FecR domain-containing protein [Deltaproteobacteria bacterium]